MHQHLHYGGEREQREKELEKTLEQITAEKFPNKGKQTVTHIQEVQSAPEGKLKEEYTETHINQTLILNLSSKPDLTNAKGNSLSRKHKATTINMKIMDEKTYW